MEQRIATIIGCHGDTECVLDTLESVDLFVGSKILLLIDGNSKKWGESLEVPCYKLFGFNHGFSRASYRNIALSLYEAYKLWGQEVDWFCYTEYDCLFGNDSFKKDLETAQTIMFGV